MHAERFRLDAVSRARLAPQVARRVERHRVEPGGEGAAAAIGADRPAEPDADVLRDVFGVGAVARPAPGDAIDEVVVPLDQPAESIPVAVARPPDQIRIGGWLVSPASSPSFAYETMALRRSLGAANFFLAAIGKGAHLLQGRRSWTMAAASTEGCPRWPGSIRRRPPNRPLTSCCSSLPLIPMVVAAIMNTVRAARRRHVLPRLPAAGADPRCSPMPMRRPATSWRRCCTPSPSAWSKFVG